MSEPDYIAYFENLAHQNKAIGHDPDAGREAFYVVSDDNRSEVEKALKNKLALPALLLDQYFDDESTESDNFRQTIQGGFSVVCKVETTGDPASIRDARHQARVIARQILNRVRRDTRMPGSVLYSKSLFMRPENNGEPTPVLVGTTGWGYGFTWQLPTQIAVDAGDWLDL